MILFLSAGHNILKVVYVATGYDLEYCMLFFHGAFHHFFYPQRHSLFASTVCYENPFISFCLQQ